MTRGVLDQAVTANGVVRFAMLPPWQALIGFIFLASLVLVGLDQLGARRGTMTRRHPGLGELVLPLVALAVLVVPFLPVVPDRWPLFQALAGPLGAIVWLGVAGLQVWTLWQNRPAPPWLARWSLGQVGFAIWVATAAVAGLAGARLTGTPVFPSGDEPHYLVLAQSLWRDGDLKIENNHKRGDYKEYFTGELEPDYLTRGTDQEIYSIHPLGLPLLLTPIYAAGGYAAVIVALVLVGATAAAIAWWWTLATLNTAGAATFAWAAIVGSAPFLFNTFTVYPEIVAALAVMIALVTTVRTPPSGPGLSRWLAVGVACGCLPWLSTKYAPMSVALLLVALARLKSEPASLLRNPKAWAVVGPYALSGFAWLTFFYAFWGSPLPTAPCGSNVQTSPLNLFFGAPGLFFDQETGATRHGTGVYPGGDGVLPDVASRWRIEAAGHRDRIRVRRVAGHRGLAPALVGRHVGAGAATGVGIVAARGADGDGVSLGAGRLGPTGRSASAAVDRRWHCPDAGHRAGRPADQQRARWHVGAPRVLVATVGVVDAGAHLHLARNTDCVGAHALVAGHRRRRRLVPLAPDDYESGPGRADGHRDAGHRFVDRLGDATVPAGGRADAARRSRGAIAPGHA